jgi:hypothetical protein
MNLTVSGSASQSRRSLPSASIASSHTPTPVTIWVSEICRILKWPFPSNLSTSGSNGVPTALPRKKVSLVFGSVGSALRRSGDLVSVQFGRGSTASLPNKTSTSVTALPTFLSNRLRCIHMPAGRLSHSLAAPELHGRSPTLMSASTRSNSVSSFHSATATYSHPRW